MRKSAEMGYYDAINYMNAGGDYLFSTGLNWDSFNALRKKLGIGKK